ncbi:MAG: 5-oxoprolinase subunit PxpA [Bacteroidota bacterium]
MLVDINCDLGESYGRFQVGNDDEVLPLISSCNIACGMHGGDPLTIEKTIQQAIALGKRIGAHPSYADLVGFGRRPMQIPAAELKALLRYQIASLKGLCELHGGHLSYVKPHGALYNAAAKDPGIGATVIEVLQEFPTLTLMGLAGSSLQDQSNQAGLPFLAEAFIDRAYTASGHLVSRQQTGAVINDPEQAVDQMLSMLERGVVESIDGTPIPMQADSFCIHGDTPAAVPILTALHTALPKAGYTIA